MTQGRIKRALFELKKTTKPFGLKLENLWVVASNQRQIREIAKTCNLIFLRPIAPRGDGGHVEHYYHFVFDLLLPLYRVVMNTPAGVVFVLEDFGPNTEHVRNLFPERVRIQKESSPSKGAVVIDLIGMNPSVCILRKSTLASLKRWLGATLAVDLTGDGNKVLLIERMPPEPYFLSKSAKKGAGASRRSIPNHQELRSTVQAMVRPGLEFHNLQLETTPYAEQVRYFDSARLVIAQHGAALANCIWMRPGAIVIELSSDESRRHFRNLSRWMQLEYLSYKTEAAHAPIDTEHFTAWLLGKNKVKRLLRGIARQLQMESFDRSGVAAVMLERDPKA